MIAQWILTLRTYSTLPFGWTSPMNTGTPNKFRYTPRVQLTTLSARHLDNHHDRYRLDGHQSLPLQDLLFLNFWTFLLSGKLERDVQLSVRRGGPYGELLGWRGNHRNPHGSQVTNCTFMSNNEPISTAVALGNRSNGNDPCEFNYLRFWSESWMSTFLTSYSSIVKYPSVTVIFFSY